MWRARNCEQVMTGDNTFCTIWNFLSHEESLRRNKIGLSLLSREGSTTQLGGKKKELEFWILFFLVFFVWPIGQSLIILLALRPRDEPLQSIALPFAYQIFYTPTEGKCIVVHCRVDSATTPPPSSSRQLVRSFSYHRKSTREESKRLWALLCRSTGIEWQPHLIPSWQFATIPNPQSVVGN